MTQQTYIYLIRPRSGFIDTMTSEEERVMDEHFAYLQSLLAQRALITAGPCLDGAFGIVMLKATSECEARRVMNDDPSVRAGVMQAELHPFKISLP